jgi:hypothetical protein
MKVTNSINSSKRKGSLSVLPDDILEKIVEKYKTILKIKYKLKDWILPEKLDWHYLSRNPAAIKLLKANQYRIDWDLLSNNTNPAAIKLLKANQYRIDWDLLSNNTNPASIELLKNNPKKLSWKLLSRNPRIFDEILE